jgi:hypothetical protein
MFSSPCCGFLCLASEAAATAVKIEFNGTLLAEKKVLQCPAKGLN